LFARDDENYFECPSNYFSIKDGKLRIHYSAYLIPDTISSYHYKRELIKANLF